MELSNEKILIVEESLNKRGYVLKERIGAGAFGVVYLVHSQRYQMSFVAKIILCNNKHTLQEQGKEINALLGLNFKNIIKMYEYWINENIIFIIFEHCSGGSLKDAILSHGPMSCPQFEIFAQQMLQALDFCHNKGVAHRDIKPSNILYDIYGRAKIADFGLALKLENGASIKGISGSWLFMAPEILLRHQYDPFKTDVWALGVTFYYAITGTLPFKATEETKLTQLITSGVYEPIKNNPQASKLISIMLTIDPSQRPNAKELLKLSMFVEQPKIPLTKTPTDLNSNKNTNGYSHLSLSPLLQTNSTFTGRRFSLSLIPKANKIAQAETSRTILHIPPNMSTFVEKE